MKAHHLKASPGGVRHEVRLLLQGQARGVGLDAALAAEVEDEGVHQAARIEDQSRLLKGLPALYG